MTENNNINVDLINMFKEKRKTEGNELPSGHPLNYKINYDELFEEEDEKHILEEDEEDEEVSDKIEEKNDNFSINEDKKEIKKKIVNKKDIKIEKKEQEISQLKENHKKRVVKGFKEIQENINDVITINKSMLIQVNQFNQTLTKDDYFIRNKTIFLEKLLAQTLDQIKRLQLKRK